MCGRDGSSTSEPVPETAVQEVVERRRRGRCLLLVFVAAIVGWGIWWNRESETVAWVLDQESRLDAGWENQPAIVLLVAFLAYVFLSAFSIPVATLLSLALGRFLGFWPALAVVSLGSTVGATLAMLLGRYIFREIVVRRLGDRGSGILESFRNHGAFYLFSLRMMPQAPFVLVNLVMSVSSIRASTFFWVSQIGMFPGTCLYVFAGSRLPSLKAALDGSIEGIVSGPLMAALILLGVFPLGVRMVWLRYFSGDDRLTSRDS